MNAHRTILITLTLCLLSCARAGAQCSTTSYWIGAPITAGTLNATGVVPGNDTVTVRHTGSYSSGRPNWWGGNYSYLGKNFSSLAISRGSSFGTGNRSSFKLRVPMDSNHVHVRVWDIRGDGFNAEPQRVQGWLNGVSVAATFTDPVNGAFISGGNVINGPTTTTSTTQAAMRVHFNGSVDSITVTATNLSDFVIVELMVACDLVLPDHAIQLRGLGSPSGNQLWCDDTPTGFGRITMQRSLDGRNWTDLQDLSPDLPIRYKDSSPPPGRVLYRLKFIKPEGWISYSNQTALGEPLSTAGWTSYPNPCTDRLYIEGPAMPVQVDCLAMDGRTLGSWRPSASERFLNTSNLPAGILLFRALHRDGSVSLFRVVHQ